jgi:hypothetical protein
MLKQNLNLFYLLIFRSLIFSWTLPCVHASIGHRVHSVSLKGIESTKTLESLPNDLLMPILNHCDFASADAMHLTLVNKAFAEYFKIKIKIPNHEEKWIRQGLVLLQVMSFVTRSISVLNEIKSDGFFLSQCLDETSSLLKARELKNQDLQRRLEQVVKVFLVHMLIRFDRFKILTQESLRLSNDLSEVGKEFLAKLQQSEFNFLELASKPNFVPEDFLKRNDIKVDPFEGEARRLQEAFVSLAPMVNSGIAPMRGAGGDNAGQEQDRDVYGYRVFESLKSLRTAGLSNDWSPLLGSAGSDEVLSWVCQERFTLFDLVFASCKMAVACESTDEFSVVEKLGFGLFGEPAGGGAQVVKHPRVIQKGQAFVKQMYENTREVMLGQLDGVVICQLWVEFFMNVYFKILLFSCNRGVSGPSHVTHGAEILDVEMGLNMMDSWQELILMELQEIIHRNRLSKCFLILMELVVSVGVGLESVDAGQGLGTAECEILKRIIPFVASQGDKIDSWVYSPAATRAAEWRKLNFYAIRSGYVDAIMQQVNRCAWVQDLAVVLPPVGQAPGMQDALYVTPG